VAQFMSIAQGIKQRGSILKSEVQRRRLPLSLAPQVCMSSTQSPFETY
jgi:hypothetical protein